MYDENNSSGMGTEQEPFSTQENVIPSYNSNQDNTYNQQNTFTSDTSYSYTPGFEQKPDGGVGFGIASLILGIIALVTFCTICLNVPLAILSIIFAIIQLVKGNGKGIAIGGLITSALSIIACIIFWVVIGTSAYKFDDLMNQYPEMYDEIYDEMYDELDDYDYDYDFDYDFDDTF